MSNDPSANVRAIEALEALRAALTRFSGDAQQALVSAVREITLTRDWLEERQRFWQTELRRRQQELERAKRALAACQASSSFDCSPFQSAVKKAERLVQEAEEALRIVQQHRARFEEANAQYQREAQRFNAMLTSEVLPKASASLSRSASLLQSYVALSAPTSGGTGSAALVKSESTGLAALRDLIFAPFASSTMRAAASLTAAAFFTLSSLAAPSASPADFGPEPPEQVAGSAGPVRQEARHINEAIIALWEDLQKQAERQQEMERILQQGQGGGQSS